jgi:hypothetical protein
MVQSAHFNGTKCALEWYKVRTIMVQSAHFNGTHTRTGTRENGGGTATPERPAIAWFRL